MTRDQAVAEVKELWARTSVRVLLAGVLLSILIGFVGGPKIGSFDWGLWATVGTAFGTSALAFVTWRLAQSGALQAAESRRLVELTQAEQLAALTPCVLPFVNSEWLIEGYKSGRTIAVRNHGKGTAINVQGDVHFPLGYTKNTPLVGTTLAGGDHATMRTVQEVTEWDHAYGYLEYGDLLGRRWLTRFHFLRPWQDAPLAVEVRSVGSYDKVIALGSYPAGWEAVPGLLVDAPSSLE